MRAPRKLAAGAALSLAAVLAGAVPAGAITGGTEAPTTGYGFVASIRVGDAVRACSGALIDIEWVITLPSCFPDGTATNAKITLGVADLTSATGREQRTGVQVVTNPQQTLALVKLSAPVSSVTPARIGTTPPTTGEAVQAAGFGRTATEWVPDKLHVADLTVVAVADTTADVGGTAGLCPGDAGGPALRATVGGPEIVGLHSAAWTKGCLGSDAGQSRNQAVETRLDTALSWIRQTVRPGTFVRLPTSAAVLDTRTGIGGATGARGAASTTTFPVTGVGGVPATGVTAVLLDVTAVVGATGTYLTLFPAGATMPGVSMVNGGPQQTISNAAVVPVPANGKISVYNQAAGVHVVADVEGYYTSAAGTGGGFVSVQPTRLFDTRDGTGATIPSGGSRVFTLTGGVVPAGASALFADLIVTGATAYGWVGTFATGGTNRSVLDYVPGTTAHGVGVKLGSDGKATFTNNSGSAIHLVLTAEGYFTNSATTGSVLRTVTAKRLLDTRGDGAKTPLAAQGTVDVATGLPAGATAVLNLTVVGNAAVGYLRAWPVGGTEPATSLVNYPDLGTGARAGLAAVRVGTGGKIRIRNVSGGTAHVLADFQGWFAEDPPL
jgi:Trypsin